MAKFRQVLGRLDEVAASKMKEGGDLDDRVCMVFCPDKYDVALKGMEAELAKVREESDINNTQQQQQQRLNPLASGSDAVRSAADAAVQKSLMRDVQMDNGQAMPSDAWLDHASMGLGVGRALEVTNEQRSIPALLGEDIHRGESDYQRILDMLVLNHEASKDGNNRLDRLESLELSPGAGDGGGGGGDDESVYSVSSQMSGISISSSASTRMTAGQRRRWQKQQKMLQSGAKARTSSSKASSSSQMMMGRMPTILAPHPEAPSQIMSAVAGRQQSFMGSQPYLCEVFHDSYGVGSEPAKGLVDCSGFSARGSREGGTGFYPPSSHVPDLYVFNTTRNSYGLSNNKVVTASPVSTKERKVGKTAARSVSPKVAGRRAQLSMSESVNKQSLAHLVFKADAHSDSSAKPALDLPASLPQQSSG